MRTFDYSFLRTGRVPGRVVDAVAGIGAARERNALRFSRFAPVFAKLEGIARVQSVKASNAIEGIVTSDRRIREIVDRFSGPLNHDEDEIAGYRDALDLIHRHHDTLDCRSTDILRLHELLLSHTPAPAGIYKDVDNAIIEIDASGHRRLRFPTVSAADTPDAMEQIILAYQAARGSQGVNQLLLIPCFVLDFLCVHPFADGNGRMSRLLTLLLLYKAGHSIGRYISLEEQTHRRKEDYYDALRESSLRWHEGANDYFPFVLFFLDVVTACYRELDKRFATTGDGRVTKRGRVEATVLGSLIPLRKADILEILPDVSATTIEAILGDLVRQGRVRKIGSGRATAYVRGG